jgi:hypothetical protein
MKQIDGECASKKIQTTHPFTPSDALEFITIGDPLRSVLEEPLPRPNARAAGARCINLGDWMPLPGLSVRKRSER